MGVAIPRLIISILPQTFAPYIPIAKARGIGRVLVNTAWGDSGNKDIITRHNHLGRGTILKTHNLSIILFASLALVIAACTGSPAATETPTVTPTETATTVPPPTEVPPTQTPIVVTVVVTEEDSATAAPASSNNSSSFATRTGCTVNGDWTTTYTVKSGDTVAKIASATNSTVANIATGNCLSNANNIYVGQVLRVPSTPVFTTTTEEATEEVTEEATEEATEEPTEEAEVTEEATEEAEVTEEATEEPTEEATEEPTEEATEEPTEEATEEVS